MTTDIRKPETCPGERPRRVRLPEHSVGEMPDRCAVCAEALARARRDARIDSPWVRRVEAARARGPIA